MVPVRKCKFANFFNRSATQTKTWQQVCLHSYKRNFVRTIAQICTLIIIYYSMSVTARNFLLIVLMLMVLSVWHQKFDCYLSNNMLFVKKKKIKIQSKQVYFLTTFSTVLKNCDFNTTEYIIFIQICYFWKLKKERKCVFT